MSATDGRRCTASTKKGKRCRSAAQHGKKVCLAHDQEARESGRFGGSQPGAGRPPKPHAVDLLRERIEANIDKWLAPLVDGLTADRGLVVGDGEHARVEYVADYPTRIKAATLALTHAYGRPAQAIAVKHSHEESKIDTEIRELLAEMDRQPSANGHR